MRLGPPLLLAALIAMGCRDEHACKPSPREVSLAAWPQDAGLVSPEPPSEHAFLMGSMNERVGTIRVSSDGTSLRVRYELFPGFELVSAHVCAADSAFSWVSPGSCPWTADNLPAGTNRYELVIPLGELTTTPCGALLTLQVHGAVRVLGSDANSEGSAYAGAFRGSIEHISSCEPAPPPLPPAPEPTDQQAGSACLLTQGYWKNHPESWPVRALTIGATRYEQAELIDLLRTPSRGDSSLILAHQLIAAELNVATGSAELPALAAARAWMTACMDSDGRLPYGVFEGQTRYAEGIRLSETLDAYNNAKL